MLYYTSKLKVRKTSMQCLAFSLKDKFIQVTATENFPKKVDLPGHFVSC